MPKLFGASFYFIRYYTKIGEYFQVLGLGGVFGYIVQKPRKISFFGVSAVFFRKALCFVRHAQRMIIPLFVKPLL